MTTDEQIKALSELSGLELQARSDNTFWDRERGCYVLFDELPEWLTSYDAIIPLIQKQYYSVADRTMDTANSIVRSRHGLLLATPAQLAEALLRATGKWQDEKGTE